MDLFHPLHLLHSKTQLTLPPTRTKTPNPSPVSPQKATQAKAWCRANRVKEVFHPTTTTNRVQAKGVPGGLGEILGGKTEALIALYSSGLLERTRSCSRWKDGRDGSLAPF